MRRTALPWILALLVTAPSGCSRASKLLGREPRVASEEAVYSAILDQVYVRPNTQLLVLAQRTPELPPTRRSMSSWLREPSALRSQTYADFRAKNEASQELRAKPDARVKVRSLSEDETRELARGDAGRWREFFKDNPTAPGVLSLSRAGFNTDSTQAFVYVRLTCGLRCREGVGVVVMRPRDGPWRVKERHLLERRR
jgi:hypothetical protein